VIAARRVGNELRFGEPPRVVVAPETGVMPASTAAFNLGVEPPVRLALSPDGRILTLVAHHFALDGLGMVRILAELLGPRTPSDPSPDAGLGRVAPTAGQAADVAPSGGRVESDGGRRMAYLNRLFRPADVVAPSAARPVTESFAVRSVDIGGPLVTARLAAACVTGCAEHAAAQEQRWRRVGVSVAVGGSREIGNTATFRRCDIAVGDDVASAVMRALQEDPPAGLSTHPLVFKLLAPIDHRFSDSFLLSNLGRVDVRAERLDFFPVARGRSAVAFGVAGVADGESALTVRAAHLNQHDAERLLDRVVTAFAQA
jgi:hypothetical protein